MRYEEASVKQKNYVAYILGADTYDQWDYRNLSDLTKGQASRVIEAYKNGDYQFLENFRA